MKGKVLIIEDNEDWQKNLSRYLENAGFYVEVADNLELALAKIQKELFHFITVDMQLNTDNIQGQYFEGWTILEIIKKFQIDRRTPTMVITGFETDYTELKPLKNLESLFFMGKGDFDRKKFIEIVEKEVIRHNLRFFDDHRDS